MTGRQIKSNQIIKSRILKYLLYLSVYQYIILIFNKLSMQQNKLFDLIKTMSRSEKGYFKKYSTRHVIGGENDYIKLFDAIEQQEQYDEKKLVKKLKGQKFIGHLAVLKKYLYKLILKSLRSYYEEGSLDLQIKSQLAEVSILYERGLSGQAAKILQRAKSIALENEKLILLQEVNDWERKLIRDGLYKNQTPDSILALEKERDLFLMKSLCLNKYLGITERTFFADYYLDAAQKKIQIGELDLELDKLYREINPSYNSFQSSMLYYHLRGKHATILKPKSGEKIYEKEMLNLLESNPQAILANPDTYIVSLFNLLAGSEHLVDVKEQVNILNKISDFENANSKYLSFKSRVKIFSYLTILRTHLFITTADFDYGKEYIPMHLLKPMKLYEAKINSLDKETIYFNILTIYFGAEDHKASLRWSNKIINEYSESITEDILETTKLLNVIIHYELKNSLTIVSVITSAERFFRTKPLFSNAVPVFLQGLKNIVLAHEDGSLNEKDAFRNLKSRVVEQIRSDNNDRFLQYFDFISWIDSKIQHRSFGDIMKEKINYQSRNNKTRELNNDREG